MSYVKILRFLLYASVIIVSGEENLKYALINALNDILNFTLYNTAGLDTNMLFGVAIISGQLKILSDKEMHINLQHKISKLNNLCENIFEIAVERNVANIQKDETQKILLSPELWYFDNPLTKLTGPSSLDYNPEKTRGFEEITEGEFRFAYEYCLRNLIEQCDVSGDCFKLIVLAEKRGYMLTHQIIYLHVMKQLILKNVCLRSTLPVDVDDLDYYMNGKCLEAFQEVRRFENKPFIDKRTIDLLIEEVVVCGLQKYDDFFTPKLADIILSYQVSLNTTSENSNHHRNITKSEAHLMSVHGAAIALYLKQSFSVHI